MKKTLLYILLLVNGISFGADGYLGQKTILKYDLTIGTDWYEILNGNIKLNSNHTFSLQQVLGRKFVLGLGYKFGKFSKNNLAEFRDYSTPNQLNLKFNSIEGQFLFYTTKKSVIAPIGSYVGFKIGYNRIHGDFSYVKNSYNSYYSYYDNNNETSSYTDQDGYTYTYSYTDSLSSYKQKITTVQDFQLYLVWGKQRIYSNHLVIDYAMELNAGLPVIAISNLYFASEQGKITPFYVSNSLSMAYLLTARLGIGFNFKLF